MDKNTVEEGTRALYQGNLKNLTTLHLSWNEIGVERSRALSQGNFTNLKNLKYLILSFSYINLFRYYRGALAI
jgi:hypothetical protein